MPLHKALIQHKPQEVISALNKNSSLSIDLNAEKDGLTLLQLAAREGFWEVVIKLLVRGVLIDKASENTKTPLLLAHENGHAISAQILLACGAKQEHEKLQSLILNPNVIRALLFYCIRYENFLPLLQPQIESSEHLQDFLKVELLHFVSFALHQNKMLPSKRLMSMAKNLNANFNRDELAITIHEENEAKLNVEFDRKDYVALNSLFNETDILVDFSQVLQQEKMDLAMLMLIGGAMSTHRAALKCMNDPLIFSRYLNLQGGSQGLLHQLVGRFCYIDAKISKEDVALFNALPEDINIKKEMILKALYQLHPDPSIAELLQYPEVKLEERIQNANLSLSIHALLTERFGRFQIYLQQKSELLLSGDITLPNVIWQHVFAHLTKEEHKNVNQVSRHFHQMMIDPKEIKKTKLISLRRKLLCVNEFIEAAQNEMAGKNILSEIARNGGAIRCTVFFASLLGLVSWFLDGYIKTYDNAKDRLHTVSLPGGKDCFSYYRDNMFKCNNIPDAYGDVCEDVCDDARSSELNLLGMGFAETFAIIFFLVSACSLISNYKSNKNLGLNQLSEAAQQIAKAMLAENPEYFRYMEMYYPVSSFITKANKAKTKLETEIATLLASLCQHEEIPEEKTPENIQASHAGRLRLFSNNNIRSLDDDEANHPMLGVDVELTDLNEHKETVGLTPMALA